MLDRRLLVVLLVSLGIFLAGPRPKLSAQARAAHPWLLLQTRYHCIFAVEDIEWTAKGQYHTGLENVRTPPPPQPLTIKAAVKFLRANQPGYTVWRDKVNSHVIHVVYSKALKWKANPMNHKFTFHGTMSFLQLAKRVFVKRFPEVHFYYNPFARTGVLPHFPDLKSYRAPLHFNVKGMTLRQFLTIGIVYQMNPQHFGGNFWQVTYMVRHGKFTGRVDIMMQGWPVSASAAAGAPAKQSLAKTR